MEQEPVQPIELKLAWKDLDALPVMASNVFLVSQTPHEFVVTFGFASPPIFTKLPTPQEIAGQTVAVSPIVRLSIPPGRVAELLSFLEQ